MKKARKAEPHAVYLSGRENGTLPETEVDVEMLLEADMMRDGSSSSSKNIHIYKGCDWNVNADETVSTSPHSHPI